MKPTNFDPQNSGTNRAGLTPVQNGLSAPTSSGPSGTSGPPITIQSILSGMTNLNITNTNTLNHSNIASLKPSNLDSQSPTQQSPPPPPSEPYSGSDVIGRQSSQTFFQNQIEINEVQYHQYQQQLRPTALETYFTRIDDRMHFGIRNPELKVTSLDFEQQESDSQYQQNQNIEEIKKLLIPENIVVTTDMEESIMSQNQIGLMPNQKKLSKIESESSKKTISSWLTGRPSKQDDDTVDRKSTEVSINSQSDSIQLNISDSRSRDSDSGSTATQTNTNSGPENQIYNIFSPSYTSQHLIPELKLNQFSKYVQVDVSKGLPSGTDYINNTSQSGGTVIGNGALDQNNQNQLIQNAALTKDVAVSTVFTDVSIVQREAEQMVRKEIELQRLADQHKPGGAQKRSYQQQQRWSSMSQSTRQSQTSEVLFSTSQGPSSQISDGPDRSSQQSESDLLDFLSDPFLDERVLHHLNYKQLFEDLKQTGKQAWRGSAYLKQRQKHMLLQKSKSQLQQLNSNTNALENLQKQKSLNTMDLTADTQDFDDDFVTDSDEISDSDDDHFYNKKQRNKFHNKSGSSGRKKDKSPIQWSSSTPKPLEYYLEETEGIQTSSQQQQKGSKFKKGAGKQSFTDGIFSMKGLKVYSRTSPATKEDNQYKGNVNRESAAETRLNVNGNHDDDRLSLSNEFQQQQQLNLQTKQDRKQDRFTSIIQQMTTQSQKGQNLRHSYITDDDFILAHAYYGSQGSGISSTILNQSQLDSSSESNQIRASAAQSQSPDQNRQQDLSPATTTRTSNPPNRTTTPSIPQSNPHLKYLPHPKTLTARLTLDPLTCNRRRIDQIVELDMVYLELARAKLRVLLLKRMQDIFEMTHRWREIQGGQNLPSRRSEQRHEIRGKKIDLLVNEARQLGLGNLEQSEVLQLGLSPTTEQVQRDMVVQSFQEGQVVVSGEVHRRSRMIEKEKNDKKSMSRQSQSGPGPGSQQVQVKLSQQSIDQ